MTTGTTTGYATVNRASSFKTATPVKSTGIRKRSIRNTKDSAEMARNKYHRNVQSQQRARAPVVAFGRHSGLDPADSTTLTRAAYASDLVRTLTPPYTGDPDRPTGFYWHEDVDISEAPAVLITPPLSNPRLLEAQGCDGFYMPNMNPSAELQLPLQHGHHGWRRLISPVFDSNLPGMGMKPSGSPAQPGLATPRLGASFLEVPIPSPRLGRPQFTDSGSAILRHSINTLHSSIADVSHNPSSEDVHRLFPTPPTHTHGGVRPQGRNATSWLYTDDTPLIDDAALSATNARPIQEYREPTALISENDELLAATEVYLVKEITSVKFLDYELISDFFLTYRSFMTPADLARQLFARLRWAVSRTDPTGRIVRVRTFVALRHWVLNYFIDDFEPDFALRALFCDLVNGLARDVQQRPGGGGGDGQVLNELKKCWKRTCELVWGPSDASNLVSFAEPSGAHSVVPDTSNPNFLFNVPPVTRAQALELAHPGGPSRLNTSMNTVPTHDSTGPATPFSDTSSFQVTCCALPLFPPHLCSGVAHAVLPSRSTPSPRKIQKQSHKSASGSDALNVDHVSGSAHADAINSLGSLAALLPGEVIRGAFVHPTSANMVSPGPLSPSAADQEHVQLGTDSNAGLRPDHDHGVLDLPCVQSIKNVCRALRPRHGERDHSPSGRKLTSRDGSSHSGPDRYAALPHFASIPLLRQEQTRSDALAVLAASIWQQLCEEFELSSVDTEVGAPPGIIRYDSDITTSSRSIFIVDDTDNTGFSAARAVASTLGLGIDMRACASNLSRDATPDIANNDATLMTGTQRPLGAPLSPPPTAPLPPLPQIRQALTSGLPRTLGSRPSYQSSMLHSANQSSINEGRGTPLSQIGIALGTPTSRLSTAQDRSNSALVNNPTRWPNAPRPTIRRRQSTGTLAPTQTSTPTSSIVAAEVGTASIASMWFAAEVEDHSTGEQVLGSRRRSSIKLLSTHSSQPNLRESFEAEVKRFASMPVNDEHGDPAATLLKLEGRFQPSPEPDRYAGQRSSTAATEIMGASIFNASKASLDTVLHVPEIPTTSKAAAKSGVRFSDREEPQSVATNRTTGARPPLTRDFANDVHSSMARSAVYARDSTAAPSPATMSTFLLDDDDEAPVEAPLQTRNRQQNAIHTFFFDDDDDDENMANQPIPLTLYPSDGTPPTPPDSDDEYAATSPSLLEPGPPPELGPGDITMTEDDREKLLLTPARTPTPLLQLQYPKHVPGRHTPFILAYSSSEVAAQLTLIEKDALDCIDWKDLINLSWSNGPDSIQDWATYIRSMSSPLNDISSIDLIIARFNLVVKWCISSVLLCATPEERATCITKFIHIAHHARTHLHNFATAAQISLGLLSSNLARLTKTWALVPDAEKAVLDSLGSLVSPLRNFAAVREEMERAVTGVLVDEPAVKGGSVGVVPFMNVYLRDLENNARKPDLVAPADGNGGSERLINFSRHRTAASIVKTVLRTLDASSKYAIKPNEEVLSKCLWLAALPNDDITSMSKVWE